MCVLVYLLVCMPTRIGLDAHRHEVSAMDVMCMCVCMCVHVGVNPHHGEAGYQGRRPQAAREAAGYSRQRDAREDV